MKRITAFILVTLMLLSVCACSKSENAGTDNNVVQQQDIVITIPKSLISEQTSTELTEEQKSMGFKSATLNDDGTLTLVIAKSEYDTLMQKLKQNTADSLESIVTGGTYPSVKDIEYNDDFSKITLIVEQQSFDEGLDSLSTLVAGLAGTIYQVYNGADTDNLTVTIDIKDKSTGNVFKTVHYPQDMEQ